MKAFLCSICICKGNNMFIPAAKLRILLVYHRYFHSNDSAIKAYDEIPYSHLAPRFLSYKNNI